jgi:hypothetical protein
MIGPFWRTRELIGPLHDTADKGSMANGSHWFLESAREIVADTIVDCESLGMSAFGGIADIEFTARVATPAISLFQSARITVCRRTWPSAGHGQKRAPAAYPFCHP